MNEQDTLSQRAGTFANVLHNLAWSFLLTMCLLAVGCGVDTVPDTHDYDNTEEELEEDFTVARCNGSGNPITSHLIVNGTVYVTEVPVGGSCNGNNAYQGHFRSSYNGWRASVWIQNNGSWKGWFGARDTNWHYYSYHDNNSNSFIHLCLDNGWYYYCGWGSNWRGGSFVDHTYYGTNRGF